MNKKPLIYQDHDSLNSAMMIISSAEKYALISIKDPELQEKRKVENNTAAILSGVGGGLVSLGFLVGVASGAASINGTSVTSGAGLTTGLSTVGKLIGGVVINHMVSGITLLIAAPVLIGLGLYFGVRKKLTSDRTKKLEADKMALKKRALACKEAIQTQLPTIQDARWNQQLREQLALVDSVLNNLNTDTAHTIQ